jgi:hypothetical protein
LKPEELTDISLIYQSGEIKCTQGAAALFELRGRFYIKTLLERAPEVREFFPKIGDIFWFDQYRNIATTAAATDWANGVSSIRQSLVGWWTYTQHGHNLHICLSGSGRNLVLVPTLCAHRYTQVFLVPTLCVGMQAWTLRNCTESSTNLPDAPQLH